MKIFRNKKGDEITISFEDFLFGEEFDEAVSAAAFLIASEKARGGNLVFSDYYDEFTDTFSLKREYAEDVEVQLPEIHYGEKPSEYKKRIFEKVRWALLGSIIMKAKFVLWANN